MLSEPLVLPLNAASQESFNEQLTCEVTFLLPALEHPGRLESQLWFFSSGFETSNMHLCKNHGILAETGTEIHAGSGSAADTLGVRRRSRWIGAAGLGPAAASAPRQEFSGDTMAHVSLFVPALLCSPAGQLCEIQPSPLKS